MKTKRLTIILCLIAAVTGVAAILTIDVPDADVPRVKKSFGVNTGLGRDATTNEVIEIIRRWMIQETKRGERTGYNVSYVEQPLVMQPTPTPTGTP